MVRGIIADHSPRRTAEPQPLGDCGRDLRRGSSYAKSLAGSAVVAGLSFAILCVGQVPEKEKFNVHVVRIKRTGEGCTAQVDSQKVRYTISSEIYGACAMLRAGEDYKAFLVSGRPVGSENDANDTAEMVIENNTENKERRNAVFEIEAQEARDTK